MTDQQQQEVLLSVLISVRYGSKPPVLTDAALDIAGGEIVGLIGQSGSGKSTLAMAILGLLDRKQVQIEGAIKFEGRDLLQLREPELREMRGRKIGLVLQSPLSSLNPALKIRTQLREAWFAHARGAKAESDRAVRAALEAVSLPSDDEFLAKVPSQMSVGQAQRVLIAMAIMHRPALLIADEATSALDVITQAEILSLFRQLNRSFGMAVLYISHDLASVAGLCDRISILHQGHIVESGSTHSVLLSPQHEYTRRLLAAVPKFPAQSAAAKVASA